mmetsp:Transcript_87912/g.192842  ORF Transcript_87912/g.192842 Transcript_87912/m.192842 type:complete len:422 (+) Transcript_87912:135-1400(+)
MSTADLTSRQRRHVMMTSSIFAPDGPSPKSLYVTGRQEELYNSIRPTLRENNNAPPEISMPSAADLRCTSNNGHGPCWSVGPPSGIPPSGPSGPLAAAEADQVMRTPRVVRTTQKDFVVHDGEATKVVRVQQKDNSGMPKEFWATNVNLQWHDTRNESCRDRRSLNHSMSADEMKRHQLSSEIFGKERLLKASTANPSADLQAETHDHLRCDTQRLQQPPARLSETARSRAQMNLSKSATNTIPATEVPPRDISKEDYHNEDPAHLDRRRSEKNFSDLFGTKMGDRGVIRGNREEVMASGTCYFLDTRSEIGTRNKARWRENDKCSATDRKQAETRSDMFGRASPEIPPMDPAAAEVSRRERACWEAKEPHCLDAMAHASLCPVSQGLAPFTQLHQSCVPAATQEPCFPQWLISSISVLGY